MGRARAVAPAGVPGVAVISDGGAAGWLEVLSRIMNVGMLVVGRTGSVEFASNMALELLACKDRKQLQERWPELRRLLQLGSAASAGKQRRASVELPQAGGVRFLRLELHAPPGATPGGCLVLLRDRQAADALETDLLLASRMRSLVHVYRVLAHDLKAPLNAMQLTLELLADSSAYDDALDGAARRRRHVEVLREELARLNRILQTMLDRKEPLEMLRQRFDLREVIREIVVLLAPQARGQRVDLRILLPDNAVWLHGYRDRIKQALLNIAINGLEAMPGGGRLELYLSAGDTELSVRITDTGSGIPDELLEAVEQIYFTTKSEGSGIGLYVARLVVESHGGQMAVQSRTGAGTTFTVTLPLHSEMPASTAAGGLS
ncbi:MAG: sensor histidine kinase [Betaproteobacteria bacterium]